MPSKQTANYKLNQWVKTDKVLMDDFNADNVKIDAAIKAVDNRLTTVDAGKATTSALDALKSTVSAQAAAMSLRNCRFVTGTYIGDGNYGEGYANTLTFDYKPVFVCVAPEDDLGTFCAMRGQPTIYHMVNSNQAKQIATWGSKSLSWYCVLYISAATAAKQLNERGKTYYYFAILEL